MKGGGGKVRIGVEEWEGGIVKYKPEGETFTIIRDEVTVEKKKNKKKIK